MYQSLVVIDDFYDDPYEVRRKALAYDYPVASVSELLQRDGRDLDRWEHLMTVPMRFNRLII